MLDSFENASVSGILERTPQKEPFYSEVRSSIQKLRNGDPSHNPLYGIIHGHVGALMEAGKLGSDWITHRVPGGQLFHIVIFWIFKMNLVPLKVKRLTQLLGMPK